MIKVLVPNAPSADQILPYLREIDANRWYSNGGPLVRRLEARMGGVAVSSATLGLELASRCVFERGKVRIPAFTFVATATALLRAGLEPVLCDVDDEWCLKDIDERSLPVAPFGAFVREAPLVDAAAAWGNGIRGNRVYSLHATKALGAGEGGMVCGDPELLERVQKLANFGLGYNRMISESGTNAKMSEYNAAVGLASLDMWAQTSQKRRDLAALYHDRLGTEIQTLPIEIQPRGYGTYSHFPILVRDAEQVSKDMASRGIETRRWYTPTLDLHPAFMHLEREDLRNCKRLNETLLCLPFHLHLSVSDVDQVCEVLEWALRKNRIFSTVTTRTAKVSTASQLRI